ncbi:MAG: hypothetical protein CMP36_03545 [Rickettsiales bacterium]|nr:hypothetical protein [Rickettsiales bacterium]OUV78994.1 MAG: hypothetical protein CBC91_04315 [Rickettsiales bacterium TMED131]|tara:strand:+ start:859 stop:2250 length:1392 start_codon:yes stop_codon:yes gene_type:complete
MSILWNSNTLKDLASAETNMKWEASGVEIDSRKIKKGDLFCALKGKNFNGHSFINNAIDKGAAACLISEDIPSKNNIAFSKVKNVFETIELMAKNLRKRSISKFIAVTGSVGKTGTKDMINVALSNIAKTYANESSYNNHVGVPLSLSRTPSDAVFCVLEIGMNKKGEIRKLAQLVKPEVAILTAVENSHLDGLKSLKNIAYAKSEILEKLPKDGCLIINNDTNFSELIIKKANDLAINNIITYGRRHKNNIQLLNYKIKDKKYFIKAMCFGKEIFWEMPLVGSHWIFNSLSILGLASYYGIDIKKILNGIASFSVPDGRGNKMYLNFKKSKFLLINDSYNSNPASLKTALKNFSKLDVKGKKILVLGDMLELGEKSLQIHLSFKEDLNDLGVDSLFTIGKYMFELQKKISKVKYKFHEEDLNKITYKILELIEEEDAVLIKGSNSINLKTIINKLIKECEMV